MSMSRVPLARVTVRMTRYNPRRFVVKDPEKLALWEMLSRQEAGLWRGGYGIKIQYWVS